MAKNIEKEMTKEQRIFLLVDWKDEGNFFLHKELQKEGLNVQLIDIPNYSMKDRTVKIRIIIMYFKYVIQAIKAVWLSTPEDVIVCWNFTTGIGVGLVSRLFFCKRRILAVNMIAHYSSGFVSKIRYLIFHFAMNQSTFYLTVNSADYISVNAKRFGVPEKNFFVLHDPVNDKLEFAVDVKDGFYVFSGGEAQRDWDIYFEAAKKLPDISFVGVARKKFFDPAQIIPDNVDMRFDLEYEAFYQLMGSARIVVLPLKSVLPCGLIVICNAALMKKAIIATRTPSTKNYIVQNETGVLVEMHDANNLKNEIQCLFMNENERIRLGENLNKYVTREFTIQKYMDTFKTILKAVKYE